MWRVLLGWGFLKQSRLSLWSSAKGINFHPLYFRININWTLEFKGAASPSQERMQFSMVSLQHSEISHTSPSIATALRNAHISQTHQCVLSDVFIPSETWLVSSGSPSCSHQAPVTPETTAQELGQQEGGRRFGSPLWNTEHKPQPQFPWQPGAGAAGHKHRDRHQIPQEKGEVAEGRNVFNSFSRSSTVCAAELSLSPVRVHLEPSMALYKTLLV